MIERESRYFRVISYRNVVYNIVYRIEKKRFFKPGYKTIWFNGSVEFFHNKEKAFIIYEAILNSRYLTRLFIRISNQSIPIKNI